MPPLPFIAASPLRTRSGEHLLGAAELEKAYQHDRRVRGFRKLAILGGLVGWTPLMPWLTVPILGVWFAGGTVLWMVEAYAPIHSDPHLRGGVGYLKFMFWTS